MEPTWLDGVERIAVLTGAGISTDSGVPDYRGPQGVWTKNPKLVDAFTHDRFRADPQVRAAFWSTYVAHAAWRAEPNAAHRGAVSAGRSGR